MTEPTIGVIGGSGIYDMEGVEGLQEISVDTPFGEPSDKIVVGKLAGARVAFLPRHGRGHRILPTEVNSRANIYALKSVGVRWILSMSAVGSLREEIVPGKDMVIPDQIIDRTKSRVNSFFGDGIVAHVAFAEPFCPSVSGVLRESVQSLKLNVHPKGTYVCMEGPLFSTKAESHLYRSWGASIIGMTALPEAKLAREAEICYAICALPTDYDCWYEGHDSVTADMVVRTLLKNAENAKRIVKTAVSRLAKRMNETCACHSALSNAIVTQPDLFPGKTRARLSFLIDKYFPPKAPAKGKKKSR
ncbi:S-methyl-5'-thioadenosine phosphorylase [bacterium]|nr:S-methyl-5'-thioadenosine phosphorylase [bacterium]